MIQRRHAIATLFIADSIATPAIAGAALLIRYGFEAPLRHIETFISFYFAFAAYRLLAALLLRGYDLKHRLTVTDHLFTGAGIAFVGVAASYGTLIGVKVYYDPGIQFSRLVAGFDFLLLTAWFALSRGAMLRILWSAGSRVRTVIVGPAAHCEALAEEIRTFAPRLLTIERTISDPHDQAQWIEGPMDNIDTVVLSVTASASFGFDRIVTRCEREGIEVFLHPELDIGLLSAARVTGLAGVPLVPLGPPPKSSPYRILKRAIDIAAASVGLLLGLPVILLAITLAKLLRGGPVLYRQIRVGLRGKPFQLVKLRTMIENAEDETGPTPAAANDTRITPLGRLLRKMRLDEIPQLWNVLRGDMSLVGPRPERPEFYDTYAKEISLYALRSSVRPGLTGLAQIHGRYETSPASKLRYDLIYMSSLSFWTDLRILLATIRVVLTGKGAR